MKQIKKLASISRVTPGSTASLELPVGPTYERVIFNVAASSGLDISDIGRINVLIDGKVVQTFKNLQRLTDINSYYKRATDSMSGTVAQFALHFFRAEIDGVTNRRKPGIGTADVQTFHIELEIASGAPASIAMTAYAEIETVAQPLGVFTTIREYPHSSSVSGEVEIDKLIRGPWYQAIHLFKADISNVIVEADSYKIVEATKGVLERTQKEASPVVRVPVTASATHVDFVLDGDVMLSPFDTRNLRDFRIKMTLDTSGSTDIVTETLNTLAQA